MKKSLNLLVLLLLFIGCGNGTTSVGNSSENPAQPAVKISQLSDDSSSRIEIPLEIFGESEDALIGAMFDVIVNGGLWHTEKNPQDFYLASSQAVAFLVSPLYDGDALTFIIRRNDGVNLEFNGQVSSDEDLFAFTDDIIPNIVIESNNDDSNAAIQLINAICTKIKSCDPDLDESICTNSLLATYQLTNEFGVPVPENSISMQELADGLDNGTYSYNATSLNQCLSDINDLTCIDVDLGYTAGDSNFENVENFIPEEPVDGCPQVFQ